MSNVKNHPKGVLTIFRMYERSTTPVENDPSKDILMLNELDEDRKRIAIGIANCCYDEPEDTLAAYSLDKADVQLLIESLSQIIQEMEE